MTTSERPSAALLERHPKRGIAAHIEASVQSALESSSSTKALREADEILDDYFPDTITGNYKKQQRRMQIGIAATSLAAFQTAASPLTKIHQEHGSFVAPAYVSHTFFESLGISPKNWPELPPAYSDAIRAGFWAAACIKKVLDDMKESEHQYYPLYHYLTKAIQAYRQVFGPWKNGPGKNRWPHGPYAENPDDLILSSIVANVNVANFFLAASAVHYLIHNNHHADSQELLSAIDQSLPQIGWESSADRHLHWVPDHLFNGHDNDWPTDAVQALLQFPVEKIISPNEYAASRNGVWCMRQSSFHSHPLLSGGPIEAAASCPGNIFITLPEPADRQAVQDFFSETGLDPQNGTCFSMGSVALALGRDALRNIVLPAYEANRRKSIVL